MSNPAINWAWEQNCGSDQTLRLLLVALCDHANERNYCWPSQQLLAAKVLVSVRTIQRKLLELEKLGFIEQRRRQRKTTIYLILLHKKPLIRHAVSHQDLDATNARLDTTNCDLDATLGSRRNLHTEPPSKEPPIGIRDRLFTDEETPKRPAKRLRRVPMSETWQPDETGVVYARERGFSDDKIRQLIVACRDYHLKHGTLIAGLVGLAATWRTWCNNEIKFADERRKIRYGRNEKPDFESRIKSYVDEARRYEDQAGIVRPSDAIRGH